MYHEEIQVTSYHDKVVMISNIMTGTARRTDICKTKGIRTGLQEGMKAIDKRDRQFIDTINIIINIIENMGSKVYHYSRNG